MSERAKTQVFWRTTDRQTLNVIASNDLRVIATIERLGGRENECVISVERIGAQHVGRRVVLHKYIDAKVYAETQILAYLEEQHAAIGEAITALRESMGHHR